MHYKPNIGPNSRHHLYTADFAFNARGEIVKNRWKYGTEDSLLMVMKSEDELEFALENTKIQHFLVSFNPSEIMKLYLAIKEIEFVKYEKK